VMSHSTDRMTPLYTEGLNTRRAHGGTPESLWPSAIPGEAMEHLWSPAGATGGNRWQMADPRKPLKQAYPQPVATHGNRFGAHGKEGVDGSSPSEGFAKFLLISSFCCPDWRPFWASTSTERPPHDRIVSGEAFELCW
jgi:hypothetical protein